MTAEPHMIAPPADIPRDRWNRPLVIPPDGGKPVAYTRCTTFVSVLEDTYNLSRWQQRMVSAGLAARPDLLLRASSLGMEDKTDEVEHKRWKKAMDGVCDDAREAAAASAAATTGTALHALTERLDRGQDVGVVPDAYKPHLAAYQEATALFTARYIEQFTVYDELRIGGTPDRIVEVDGENGLFIADVKTGTVDFGFAKMAMQLSVYAHSRLYRPDGARATVDGLRTDKGIIIALDATTGDCVCHWINLTEAWDAVQLAASVRAWRAKKRDQFLSPYQPATAIGSPVREQRMATAAAVHNAIRAAGSVDELTQLWIEVQPTGLWTDDHTTAAAARKAALQAPAQTAV